MQGDGEQSTELAFPWGNGTCVVGSLCQAMGSGAPDSEFVFYFWAHRLGGIPESRPSLGPLFSGVAGESVDQKKSKNSESGAPEPIAWHRLPTGKHVELGGAGPPEG